ncbi:MAG: transporter substrate-binding domain-containing protein [Pseudomonadota bacterium]|nr:transporter substrate-binding domain-containing protein [Pseudomonadota bacterium]
MKRYLNSVLFFSLVLILNLFSATPPGFAHTYQSDKSVSSTAGTAKTADQRAQVISFSEEERAYLEKKKQITMCVDPDWMPLEKIENGRHIGMTAEYITILEKTIGLPIVLVPTRSWSESITFAKSRKCDIYSLAMPTPERRTYMNFTKPYLSIPLVMAAKTETPFIDSISTITDKKIGIVKGYAFNEILRRRFPKMQIVDVDSISAGLKQVVENKLFGFIGTLATVGYTIQKDFVGELKVTGKFDERWELGIAARNDEPLLINIFDKAIAAIDSTTHQKILNNWIAVRYDRKPDYGPLIQILLLVFAGIAVLLYRNHTLGKYNKKLERQNLEITRQAEKLKETEKQLLLATKMEAVGLMAGGVAHDLNNILSGIISYPEIILMKLPPESELRRPVKAILDSGKRAADVVADMLTVTRGIAAVREVVAVENFIEILLESPEIENLKKRYDQITVTTVLDPELLAINCSPTHLRKSLLNLLINAFEAIKEEGNITITTCNLYIEEPLSENNFLNPGEYISIIIKDTGSGISATDKEHIFEPFYSKKIMGRSGTGLGLTVVWNTIRDHNGEILVESDENGTIFTIYLPATRKKIKDEGREQEHAATTLKKLQGKQEKILIVDDEEMQREIAEELLNSLGYQTQTAASGEAGIELLAKNQIDLVLLDMIMDPGINGRRTYARMAEIKPGLKAVIASGFSENEEVEKTLTFGPSTFIKKPYTINQLGKAVQELLKYIPATKT